MPRWSETGHAREEGATVSGRVRRTRLPHRSGWGDYQRTGHDLRHPAPTGLRLASKLPHPIFTPATKAATGHDGTSASIP